MGSPKDKPAWALLPSALWDIDFSDTLDWIERQPCADVRAFKLLIRSDPDALCECLGRVRVHNVSAGAIEMVGASSAADCARRSLSFLTEESRADFVRVLLAAVRKEADVHLETTMVTQDGEPFDIRVHWRFIADEEARFTRALVSVVDIREERKLQQRLLLAERMAAMGTLTASIIHEIKNPLTYVWNHLRTLQTSDDGMSRASRQMLREALDGAERIRSVAHEITEFSHAPDESSLEIVDLNEVLDAALRMAHPEVQHRASVVREYAPERLQIRASKSRVGQVFLNIIVNAAQAISVGDRARNTITVRTKPLDSDRVCVEISDTGPGIPPHMLRRIFDPFVTTKAAGHGTGLGLSICRSIVHALGGTIELKSQPGNGTVAQVVFPRTAKMTRSTSIPPGFATSIQAASRQRLKILVVDDEPVIARLIKKVFVGHEVSCAHDGRKAVELMNEQSFDVVLCDLIMPEMTGMDVYRAALQRPRPIHDRIVFMTGGAFTQRARDFLHKVPNLCIEKPFELAHLERMVYEAAARAKASGECELTAPRPARTRIG